MPKKYNIRFLHCGDIHLGKNQYGLDQRGRDFATAFEWVCDQAIKEDVDFVIIAGDLFDKRNVNAKTLEQAIKPLSKLFDNSIDVFIIEGNHDRPYYRDKMGWIEYLSKRYFVTYIPKGHSELIGVANGRDIEITNAEGERDGGFVGDFFQIGMMHAGVEGIIPNMSNCISKEDILKMRAFDYLALSHIHKPYSIDGRIFNPGSTEHWSISEHGWNGGYYLVDVDTRTKKFKATHVPTPKRTMIRTTWTDSGYALVEVKEGSIVELTLLGESEEKPEIDWIREGFMEAYPDILYLKIVDKTTRPDTLDSERITKDRTEIERDVINELTGDENLTGLILELKDCIDDDAEDLLGVIENG